ncbi:MAG: exodeoxyribonuclease III [Zoogloeaceae bacterium]|jgi:exodeoxyribonuclease-3|nr:exodeoxyribonuclease III [Zoogloeaceae bacterium]
MVRILTLNLNGIRAAWKKGAEHWLLAQNADGVAFQELKAAAPDLDDSMRAPASYHAYYAHAEKKGYSGVGLWTRNRPVSVLSGMGAEEFDAEGRYLRADFADYSLISLYVPSGSASPDRQAAKFRFMEFFYGHLAALMAENRATGREFILCGDWNIARQEIDLKNWKGNLKNSGFLPEERQWFSRVLDELGWVDVFRSLYPDAGESAYTWWSNRGQARAKNVGWRIDYQIATPKIAARALRGSVYTAERFSDHAPLLLEYA